MKRLTRQQKLEAYSFCLLGVLDYDYWGDGASDQFICNNLAKYLEYLEVPNSIWNDLRTIENFPEMRAQMKIIDNEIKAWKGSDSPNRIKAIERAIALTEKLKK